LSCRALVLSVKTGKTGERIQAQNEQDVLAGWAKIRSIRSKNRLTACLTTGEFRVSPLSRNLLSEAFVSLSIERGLAPDDRRV
jgi:hypothetical protein